MGFARLTVLLGAGAFLAGCEDPVAPDLDPPDRMLHATGGSSSITATPISGTQVDVVWPDNSRNEAGFEVHRSSPGAGFTLRASTDPNVTSYRDEGLTPDTEYCYKVRPFKITGRKRTYSTFSEVACATTPNPPAPASDATAVPQNSHVVDIRWTDNSSTEVGFRVQRGSSPDGPWTTLATTGANATRSQDVVWLEQQVCYRVVAFAEAEASPSNVDCTTPPSWPSDLTAQTPDMNTVELHWTDNSAVEDGYEVQRWDEVLGGWNIVADLPANASSYRDEGLTADVWYWYLVRAKKDGGYSYFSNYATVFTASAPPDAPSGVAVFSYFGSSAYVSWIDNSSNEEGFRVQRGPDDTGPWETAATTAADESFFYEDVYPAGQKLCYQIIAFNGRGESSPSADCATPPPAVTDLAATTIDHQTIDLSWTYNSTAADGFVLYRYGYPYGEFHASVELAGTATSHRDEGLPSNTSYWYFIVAINEDGYSEYSNGVIASTDVLPGADQTSTATASRPGSARAVPKPRTLAKALAGRAQAPSADRPSRRKPMCPSTVPLRHECPRSGR